MLCHVALAARIYVDIDRSESVLTSCIKNNQEYNKHPIFMSSPFFLLSTTHFVTMNPNLAEDRSYVFRIFVNGWLSLYEQ